MTSAARRAILLGLAIATSAGATTLIALEVPGLTRLADVVVRGQVLSVTPRLTADRARIMTDVELEVLEVLKGAPGPRLAVMQPGGVLGEVGQVVHGSASFTPGEEVVLFLERRGERYLVAGMHQGKYRIDRSSDGRSAFARSEGVGEVTYVDQKTHEPVARQPQVLALDVLLAQIRAAAAIPADAGGSRPTPTVPVKATP